MRPNALTNARKRMRSTVYLWVKHEADIVDGVLIPHFQRSYGASPKNPGLPNEMGLIKK